MAGETFIRDVLDLIKEKMADNAIHCIDSFLGVDAVIREPWKLTDKLQGDFDYAFVLNSFNDKYESTLCIGAPLQSMTDFFDCDVTLAEAKDAVSELANIFSAVTMDIPEFVDVFGVLVQTPPEEMVNKMFFPEEIGVEGRVWVENEWLYFGFAIRKNKLAVFDLL